MFKLKVFIAENTEQEAITKEVKSKMNKYINKRDIIL